MGYTNNALASLRYHQKKKIVLKSRGEGGPLYQSLILPNANMLSQHN